MPVGSELNEGLGVSAIDLIPSLYGFERCFTSSAERFLPGFYWWWFAMVQGSKSFVEFD